MFEDQLLRAGLALLVGYGLGSIPFGLLLTRAAGTGDLRSVGSGNIGATNVLRTGRKDLAAATLALDALKGMAAVWLGAWLAPGFEAWAATGALFGHMHPVWLRFRGGKGVATLGGVAFALHWPVGLTYVAVWVGILAATRFSSLAGVIAAAAAPVAAVALGRGDLAALLIAFALIVLWKHRYNVRRLMSGTEPRIGTSGQANAA